MRGFKRIETFKNSDGRACHLDRLSFLPYDLKFTSATRYDNGFPSQDQTMLYGGDGSGASPGAATPCLPCSPLPDAQAKAIYLLDTAPHQTGTFRKKRMVFYLRTEEEEGAIVGKFRYKGNRVGGTGAER